MVIGASGSIGSVSARLLAMAFDEVYMPGAPGQAGSAQGIDPEGTPDAKVTCATDYNDCSATWT
jgi:hypothetical protein